MTPNLVTPIERVISNVWGFASDFGNKFMEFFSSAGPVPIGIGVAALVIAGIMLMKGSPVKGV